MATQEIAHVIDDPLIILRGNAADAGRGAAFDLVLQARPGAALEDRIGARAQGKGLLQRRNRPVHGARGGEGPKEFALFVPLAPVLADLGPGMVAPNDDVGERLVVPQQDVVAGFELFYEVRFEKQSLDLGVGRDHLERHCRRHHPQNPVGLRASRGVARYPLTQIAGLADVKNVALVIQHAVDAG